MFYCVPIYYKNEKSNFSSADSLLVPFSFKNFLVLRIFSVEIFLAQIYCLFLLVLIVKNEKSVLMLYISVRLMSLNFYFCDVFFLTKKMVQKGVYKNEGLFLL